MRFDGHNADAMHFQARGQRKAITTIVRPGKKNGALKGTIKESVRGLFTSSLAWLKASLSGSSWQAENRLARLVWPTVIPVRYSLLRGAILGPGPSLRASFGPRHAQRAATLGRHPWSEPERRRQRHTPQAKRRVAIS